MIAMAGVGALYHDGDGDLRVFGWSKADKPGEVDFFAVCPEVGCAGFTGNAQAGYIDESSGAPSNTTRSIPSQRRDLPRLFKAIFFSSVVNLSCRFAGEGT